MTSPQPWTTVSYTHLNASALSRPRLEKLEQNDGNLTLRGKTYHVEVPQRVKQAVGKWESGKSSPDPTTVARIAEILSTTADFLLGLYRPCLLYTSSPSDSDTTV